MKMYIYPADILLPKRRDAASMTLWATVACDQYTSQPEYWERVEKLVGDAHSTLRLMLPEAYLGKKENAAESVHAAMRRYLDEGFFERFPDCAVYVERTQSDGRLRRGLVCCIDLEDYDYTPGSSSAVRATERTVAERIPPRLEIRRNAPLDMPHVMMLADDPDDLILGRFAGREADAYSFPLMEGGGYVKGSFVTAEELAQADEGLASLVRDGRPALAVGDGNHSLASAKAAYEELKAADPSAAQGPARYALCEIVNIYDEALEFEPIYRLVRTDEPSRLLAGFTDYACERAGGAAQRFEIVCEGKKFGIMVPEAGFVLPVATLQHFLDTDGSRLGVLGTDYIHGREELISLASRPGYVGFLFEGMKKEDLFDSVAKDGCLPRKTFSMGHAADKRYYLECRKIGE